MFTDSSDVSYTENTFSSSETERSYNFIQNPGAFSKYGKTFQEKIMQGFLFDHSFAAAMVEVCKPNFFDVKYLEYLCEICFSYYGKYKTFPSFSNIVTIIKDDLVVGNDIILREQIINFLTQVKTNPNLSDVAFVKDKTLDFCKRQAIKNALEQAVSLIDNDKFESVVGIVKKAASIGIPQTQGHCFFDELEARFEKINRNVIGTGLQILDQKSILNGGLGRGEIGIVVATPGVGKSHFLISVGAEAIKNGKNVLHYTFELTEHAIGLRYDSNICNIDISDIHERKDEVINTYKEGKGKFGKLIIKEYPTGSCSVAMIKNHIEKLSLKGFIPNLIVIDYADIMRSSRTFDSLRHELKLVYEELRNLAMEMNCPIWTASQANREASSSDIIGLENMSESYGKAMVADFVISLSRKPEEKSSGLARFYIAKNRAGVTGNIFPVKINTCMSKFEPISSDELSFEEVSSDDQQVIKSKLKKKWEEIKNISENNNI
jgi:hypothetical protein